MTYELQLVIEWTYQVKHYKQDSRVQGDAALATQWDDEVDLLQKSHEDLRFRWKEQYWKNGCLVFPPWKVHAGMDTLPDQRAPVMVGDLTLVDLVDA